MKKCLKLQQFLQIYHLKNYQLEASRTEKTKATVLPPDFSLWEISCWFIFTTFFPGEKMQKLEKQNATPIKTNLKSWWFFLFCLIWILSKVNFMFLGFSLEKLCEIKKVVTLNLARNSKNLKLGPWENFSLWSLKINKMQQLQVCNTGSI